MCSKCLPSSLLLSCQGKGRAWRKSLDLSKSARRDQDGKEWEFSAEHLQRLKLEMMLQIRKGSYYTRSSLGKAAICIPCLELKGCKWIFGLVKSFSRWYTAVPIAAGIMCKGNVRKAKGGNMTLGKDQELHKPLPSSSCSIVEYHHTSHTCTGRKKVCVIAFKGPGKHLGNQQVIDESNISTDYKVFSHRKKK